MEYFPEVQLEGWDGQEEALTYKEGMHTGFLVGKPERDHQEDLDVGG
jgi:hypothetical protein